MNFDGCFLSCTFAYVNVGRLQVSGKSSHQMKWKSDFELWSWAGAESEDILSIQFIWDLTMWVGNGFMTFQSNVGICNSCLTTLTLVWGHCSVWKCEEPITQWRSTTSQKTKTYATQMQKLQNWSLSILYEYFSIHVWKLRGTVTELKLNVSQISVRCIICFLRLWLCASLIYINNCPTRCNTKQSIYYSASSLYMFWVSTTPINWSTQNCNYSLRYWSYFLCSYLSLTWPKQSIILQVHSTWPCWREVAAQKI